MISLAAVGKVAKTSSLLMLMLVMTVVPLFVHSTVPPVSAWGGGETSTATTTFSGRAFDVSVGSMTFVDTGPLPPSGGTIDATVVPIILPSPPGGSVDALMAVTMGFDSKAQSDAAVSALSLPGIADLPAISADLVMAESIATCAGVSGSSSITGLTIDGLPPIAILGTPNQVVTFGFVTITINEQIPIPNGIQVNALDIRSVTGTDIIIASAESDIICANPSPHVAHDFVTGGGWIPGLSGGKATFGFVAGFKDDKSTPSGHLTYIDHSTSAKVQSTDVTTYTLDASNQRTFGGDANYNGASGYTYKATVQDNGEPGTGVDTFSISVYNPSSVLVYTNSGTLGGGNIEIHN
jgi:hypothetical protein